MKKQATGSVKAFFSKLGTSCNIQVNERLAYEADWRDFLKSLPKGCQYLHEVTPELADANAQQLRERQLAVDTHNRNAALSRSLQSHRHGRG